MSEKIIIETLSGLGLTEKDAQVYIQLAKRGPILARDITESFKINKAQVYRSLKNLQSKGIVEATIQTPQNFTALAFEKVFDLYLKIKKDEVKKIEQNREATMQQWRAMAIQQTPQAADRFMVIEGKNYIYTKIQEMISIAKTEVLAATNITSLLEAEIDNVLDKFVKNKKVDIKLISEISPSNAAYTDTLLKKFPQYTQGKHIDLRERFLPRFILTDENELLFLTTGFENTVINKPDAGLWTNNKSLIQAFKVLFRQLWEDGVDFKERINQLTNGQEPLTSQVIKDPQEAYRLIENVVRSAKKEILIIAPEIDLEYFANRIDLVEACKEKQIDIIFLSPITENNKEYAKKLSKYAEIRPTHSNYFRTMIIDREKLIQLKNNKEPLGSSSIDKTFQGTLYTNIPEFVKGRYDLINDLWNHSPIQIEKLKLNEARFRSIIENNEEAIILASPNGDVLEANNAACQMFAMTIEDMKSANRQKMLVLEQKAIQAFKERETRGFSKREFTYRRKDGSTFQGETTASNFTDTDGKTKNCIIIRDVTERTQCQNVLKQSRDRLFAVFNCIGLGVCLIDAKGKITQCNPAFQQITGYSQQELKTKPFLELTHHEDRLTIKQSYQDLLQSKTGSLSVEKRTVRKDDKIINAKINISVLAHDETEKSPQFIVTLEETANYLELAEYKKTLELLKTSQERFNTVLKNSIDFIYRHNLQTGQYEFASPAVKTILGYEPQEIVNMSNEEVLATVHPDDLQHLQLDLLKIIQEGSGFSEYRIKKKDGTYIWYRNQMIITYDEAGRPLYRDGIGRDINEIKQAQAILNQKKTNR